MELAGLVNPLRQFGRPMGARHSLRYSGEFKVMLNAQPSDFKRLAVIGVVGFHEKIFALLAGHFMKPSALDGHVKVGSRIGVATLFIRGLMGFSPVAHVCRLAKIAISVLWPFWSFSAEWASGSGGVNYHSRGTFTLTRLCI